jgi:hypothetical protein
MESLCVSETPLDQVEVPLPNDLRNACTDLTAAYMLFCERSGQFLNREVDYIHTVWGDANEKLEVSEDYPDIKKNYSENFVLQNLFDENN